MFWPGSDADIEGMYPTYWMHYDDDFPYKERVEKVLYIGIISTTI